MKRFLSFLSLFGSLSTLFCCALPVLFVSLGMGAVFASLSSAVPQIVWLVERKNTLFVVTGILLAFSFVFLKRAERLACPIDPKTREVCQVAKPWASRMLYISVLLYIVGAFFSFVLPRFLYGSP